MDKAFKIQVKIITPEGITHQAQADALTAPAVKGTVSILPHHIPFFTRLDNGEIKIRLGDKVDYFAITGGFMDVSSDGVVTVLTDSAKRSEEIDEKAAEKARQEAKKLLSEREKLSEKEFAIAEASLRKSILELKISQRRKKVS